MRLKLLAFGVGAFLLLSFAAAPVMVSAAVFQTTIIAMSNTMFLPQVTAINVGDTVTWTNYDTAPHTVTSTTDNFNVSSPMLQKGDKFSFTFAKAGVFTYYCEVHPFMVATIYVGVPPPQTVAVLNPSSSPGVTLSVNRAAGGGVSLVASLGQVPQSLAAGVPVSFFARYTGNSSTYWLKLDTRATGSNGSARLVLPSSATVTGFQAYAPRVGNVQAGYSNVVDLGAPAPAVSSGGQGSDVSFVSLVVLAAVAGLFIAPFMLLRKSRS